MVEAGLTLVATQLALLEAHLRGRDWMANKKRTILDAYALPMLNWAVPSSRTASRRSPLRRRCTDACSPTRPSAR